MSKNRKMQDKTLNCIRKQTHEAHIDIKKCMLLSNWVKIGRAYSILSNSLLFLESLRNKKKRLRSTL